ncbi:MAG: hypothetical protein CL917_05995 [Deltaproteobacteria bacterium]|nr:hypothetical protein [Deltaproteobacteria bacterium]
MFQSEIRRHTHSLGCALSLIIVAAVFSGEVEAETFRLVPNQFDPVEAIDVPLRSAVPEGDWIVSPAGRLPLRSPIVSREEQALRMAQYWPSLQTDQSESEVLQRDVSLNAAALYEAAGDWSSARYAYLRAIELGGGNFQVWRALAHVALLDRDPLLAEAAQFAALESIRDSVDAIELVERRAEVYRDLATLYMLEGRANDTAHVLEVAEGLDAPLPHVRAWLDRVRFPTAFAPQYSFFPKTVDWPEEPERGVQGELLVLVDKAHDSLPPWIRKEMSSVDAWSKVGSRRSLIFTVGMGFLALVALLRMIRQRGDLIVAVEHPEELRGVFRIQVTSRKPEEPGDLSVIRERIRKGGPATHHERHLVNRETQFNRLLSRRFWVRVEGMLLDPNNDEVLADFTDQKLVRIRHRRTVRLEFAAFPETCPVDFRVSWHQGLAEDVSVVVAGHPETLRRASEGLLRMQLVKGSHRLIVGGGDRVLERDVEVNSYQPACIDIDLGSEAVIFKGCPPAVQPYLLGDIESVSRHLELDGQADLAHRMLARFHSDRGQQTRAADHFESAGDFHEAALIYAREHDYERAAKLLIESNEPIEAAQMYRRMDNWIEAGRCYELGRDFERAVECYSEARAIDLWLSALERSGEVFKAAKLALENDRRPRAMRLLQCIASDDEDYAESTWLLTLAFEREGHFDLAAQQLERHIATFLPGSAASEKYSRLADLLEQSGSLERALEVLEDLRRREPTYPEVAPRIEMIRKQRSVSERSRVSLSEAKGLGDAATAFVSESRYEILEEIGRGGMGVVYQARDRRLDRIVALKRLPEDLRRYQPRAAQLFVREAQAAARLNHPHIVTVYDAGQEDGHLFIAMELLSGEPFNLILQERSRLRLSHLLAVASQVASALQYAHSQGVVHRDIKTGNLFLTTEDTVKVMDFGLAKMFEEVRGGTTVITGTPFYMSPEQVMGGAVDRQTDLYSLGVTLFELATGSVPFPNGDVAYHHRHTDPPDPRSLTPDLPAPVAELILNLLEKDPEQRCASADDLLDRLVDLRSRLLVSGEDSDG